MLLERGFFRTELLRRYAEATIEDYAERTEQTVRSPRGRAWTDSRAGTRPSSPTP
jgi:hypothetical protein